MTTSHERLEKHRRAASAATTRLIEIQIKSHREFVEAVYGRPRTTEAAILCAADRGTEEEPGRPPRAMQ